jgi:hypothetical protein
MFGSSGLMLKMAFMGQAFAAWQLLQRTHFCGSMYALVMLPPFCYWLLASFVDE